MSIELHVRFAGRLVALAGCLMLAACDSGGGGGGAQNQPRSSNGDYLFVAGPKYYYGTREVGSHSTQEIELANRGGDVYPIRSMRINGQNAEEFSIEHYGEIVLNPAEAVRLDVSFEPLSPGAKLAGLDIDYDTIVQVTDQDNQNEQLFYRARDLASDRDYDASLDTYREYLDYQPVTVNKQRAAIRIPVIQQSQLQGADESFATYLEALNARDATDYPRAIDNLERLVLGDPAHPVSDDALYLKGYIQLIDLNQPDQALVTMMSLRQRYPESSYYDSALYSEGLARQARGETDLARSIFEDLKHRHTGFDAFGVQVAKDNLMSKLWFERAVSGIESLS